VHRVRGRESFRKLARSSQRAAAGGVRVARIDAPDRDSVAVAFAVSRRHGSAVRRNRLRRRLRAAAVELAGSGAIAPGAYLVSPRHTTAAEAPFPVLRDDLAAAVQRLDSRSRSRG
jgi:ribonuclease P protein component